MRGRRVVRLVATALVVAGPILFGPATPRVLAHAQLVTSTPESGSVVIDRPSEIRLVFSEPLDPAFTSADVLGPDGRAIVDGGGTADPADPYTLTIPVAALADGLYTVEWQALSRADGHRTNGFFTFGVGDVTPPDPTEDGTSGTIHAGHDAATSFLESESRIAGSLGLLLALGLPVISWLVLRSSPGSGFVTAAGATLVLAALGAGGLLLLGIATLGADPLRYVTESRTGSLLGLRVVVTLVGAIVVFTVLRRRPIFALAWCAGVAAAGLVLLAVGSHAAAYASPAPILALLVHTVAAAIWVSGVAVLAWSAAFGSPVARARLGEVVPRFSAIALVAVGLIGISGLYADWVQTRTIVSVATPYATTLLAKSVLAITAFGIGAVNLVRGGRSPDPRWRPRILLEGGLAAGVLIATGVLTSGSPPAQDAPIPLAAARSSGVAGEYQVALSLAPGRPGPTRFDALVVPAPPAEATVELQLTRTDETAETRLPLRPSGGTYRAGGAALAADSMWDAAVLIRGTDGVEVSRTRFVFALDAAGVAEGRAVPPLDPVLVLAIVLLVAAGLGAILLLGGVRLPRLDPGTARLATGAGSAVSLVLALVLLFGGPRL
jgi:copper transport protein